MPERAKVSLPVRMKWVEAQNEWHLINSFTGKTLQEFLDCENIDRAFPGLNKKTGGRYLITIESRN